MADAYNTYMRNYLKNYRTKFRWVRHYESAKYRCENKHNISYKYYGEKGIKFLLTKEQVKELWFRDGASGMIKPSLDRKDPDGNYEFSNCRFIEQSYNSRRAHAIQVAQHDKAGNLLKIYSSQLEAAKQTGFLNSVISKAIIFGYLRYGFYWKKVEWC